MGRQLGLIALHRHAPALQAHLGNPLPLARQHPADSERTFHCRRDKSRSFLRRKTLRTIGTKLPGSLISVICTVRHRRFPFASPVRLCRSLCVWTAVLRGALLLCAPLCRRAPLPCLKARARWRLSFAPRSVLSACVALPRFGLLSCVAHFSCVRPSAGSIQLFKVYTYIYTIDDYNESH